MAEHCSTTLICGIIRDRFGAPCERKVYAMSRPTPGAPAGDDPLVAIELTATAGTVTDQIVEGGAAGAPGDRHTDRGAGRGR